MSNFNTQKQHQAVEDVRRLYQAFVKDPDFEADPGETRKETALDEAKDRVQQQINNQAVYELGKQLSPQSRGLVFNEMKHRWVIPEAEKWKEEGRRLMGQYQQVSQFLDRIRRNPNEDPSKIDHLRQQKQNLWDQASRAQKQATYYIKTVKSNDNILDKELKEMESIQKAFEFWKQMSMGAAEARRKGLVPKSGDWQHPGRWVRPPNYRTGMKVGEFPSGRGTPADLGERAAYLEDVARAKAKQNKTGMSPGEMGVVAAGGGTPADRGAYAAYLENIKRAKNLFPSQHILDQEESKAYARYENAKRTGQSLPTINELHRAWRKAQSNVRSARERAPYGRIQPR